MRDLAIGVCSDTRLQYNETRGTYDTFNMTSADEFSNQKNNSAFTNGGFSVALKRTIELAEILNITVPSNWSDIADNMTVLTDPASGIVLEFGALWRVDSSTPVAR